MTDADVVAGVAQATRRIFTREYKLRILTEYEAAAEHGARGALLRREGLFQSHIGKWRRARDGGRLSDTPRAGSKASHTVGENERLRGQGALRRECPANSKPRNPRSLPRFS